MTSPLLLAMPGNAAIASALRLKLDCEVRDVETRHFPDGETHLRIGGDMAGRNAVIVCTLDAPDAKFLPLLFAADTARELGAASVGLAAPYLAYMRQDRRFEAGEAVTSRSFARCLSQSFDWLTCIDPHLHRYKALSDLYSIPAQALHATALLAEWIKHNIESPVLIGPDSESVQWVSDIAARTDAPFAVLDKVRTGDRSVEIRLPKTLEIGSRTPVLLDDIISSGETMLQAVRALRQLTPTPPVCVAVHAIFANDADAKLAKERVRIITSNSIAHPTNAVDVSGLLAEGIAALLRRSSSGITAS